MTCLHCGYAEHGPGGCTRSVLAAIRDGLFKAFTHAVTSYGVEPSTENYGRVLEAHGKYVAVVVDDSVRRGSSALEAV